VNSRPFCHQYDREGGQRAEEKPGGERHQRSVVIWPSTVPMPMRSRVVIDPYNDKAVPAIWPWGSIARAAMKIVLTNWSVFQKLS